MSLNSNQFTVTYTRQPAFNIFFSTTLIDPDLTYAITIYVKGSVTTDISTYDFIDEERIYLVLNPSVAYNFSDTNTATILTSGTATTTPYQGGNLEYIDYSLTVGEYTYGEQTFQLLVKGSELLYSADNYCSLLMYCVGGNWSNYASADIFMLNGISSVVDEKEASDAEKIITALGQQTSTLLEAIESGDQKVINTIVQENEALRDLIQGEPQDTSVGSEFADVAGQYSELDAEASGMVDDFYNREVNIDGQTYSLSMADNQFEVLQSAYSGVLDNFTGDLTYTSTLFRQSLDTWIRLFGIFVFFPLILGLIGALLGRYKET